jgi:hypothetical protein
MRLGTHVLQTAATASFEGACPCIMASATLRVEAIPAIDLAVYRRRVVTLARKTTRVTRKVRANA